ncbi:recovery protein 3 isoform X2 [Tasmannia lanceolata]|uniref:recovery protein 3 isoform X2 n=1 Tax=Tasmannia lanceolata TaxID=3420 RepID=UPI004062D495
MASHSQSDSNVFDVRIVSIDYYMSPPIPDLDICYSTFHGREVVEVPVIRVYGSTLGGQKTCLHVHRALPYLYVPCHDVSLQTPQEGHAYSQLIFHALENALKLKSYAGSKRQHVHGCSLVRARKFYGYHSSEELFVKIYLYYPHEVARAATLLLGGAVLNRSFQPHESHIPYLLQFMVDYNLYGMGLLHLSKVKFRHPLPDDFVPRSARYSDQCRQDLEKADPGRETCHDQAIWLSSTIPSGWIWPLPACELDASLGQGLHLIKRQSTCELEGDATVDEILNQHSKMYTSLSQTGSEVQMVQSLVPIWEEESDRTGMHEMVKSPDPSKPLPENVLKTFSDGLEFEAALLALCMEAQKSLSSKVSPPEEDKKFVQSVRSITDVGNLLAHREPVNFNSSGGECFKFHKENRIVSVLSQGSLCEEEEDAISSEQRHKYHGPTDVILSAEMTETIDRKVVDIETLGLLRWFASSQAVEELSTDDELVHDAILSPLLPATTIEKVLEKAHLDYENESQQECQDILDSVDGIVKFETSKEKAVYSATQKHLGRISSENVIPQADGAFDDQFTTPQIGNAPKMEMSNEDENSSPHPVPENTSAGINIDHKKKQVLWGSLPLSTKQNVQEDSESACLSLSEVLADKLISDDVGKRYDDSAINADKGFSGLKEGKSLTGCSVRDLMRRKRVYRAEPSECGSGKVKKVVSGKELNKETFFGPECLECHLPQCSKDVLMPGETPHAESFHPDFQAVVQEGSTWGETCRSGACSKGSRRRSTTSCNFPRYAALPLSSLSDGSLEVNAFSNEHFEFNEGPNDIAMDIAPENGFEYYAKKNTPFDSNALAIEKCVSGEQDMQIGSFEPEGTLCTAVKTDKNPVEYIEMTFQRKPPGVICTDRSSKDTSLALTVHNHDFPLNAGNSEGTLAGCSYLPYLEGGVVDDLLPFFMSNSHEGHEVCNKSYTNNEIPNSLQESVLGVPIHHQNDGSFLYLLTPAFSPPSSDRVRHWLLQLAHQNTTNVATGASREKLHAVFMESSSPKSNDVMGGTTKDDKVSTSGKRLSDLQDIHAISSNKLINPQAFLRGGSDGTLPESNFLPSPNAVGQDKSGAQQIEFTQTHTNRVKTEPQKKGIHVKDKKCTEKWQDLSQISGPDPVLKLSPPSQTGFRDPASVGAAQHLTLLSIEVLAESRGDLRPDPRFDAINVIALAIQEDVNPVLEILVILRINDSESQHRNLDGVSGCKVVTASGEEQMFDHFVNIICSFDPDIFMGWEIQGGSLGFLAERASHLGIRLLKIISRTPTSEPKVAVSDSENPETKIPDNRLPESAMANSVVLDDVIIEDEWGRTHASGVHVGGRIVLNIWRLMRSEIKLNMYSVEAVSEAILRRKLPSIPCRILRQWFSSGAGQARFRCIEHVVERAKLNLEIMNQLDMVNRTSELARVFGIDFFSVLSRGSQYRVESMFLRLAHTQNYIAISPGNQQVFAQPAMECLPLVMEPESGFFADPVVVLDFQSLYPSMIIAYNLCFCTCLGKVLPSKENTLGVSQFSLDPQLLIDIKDQILLTPNGVMYVPSKVRKGVLPRLLEEILSTRIMVKQAMKKLMPSQRVLHRIFNARQLALKLIANVTYGYTAAGFSGRMPCAELADSIVQCGRRTLEKAISVVNTHDKWNARVIYGDTDSMFVLLKGRTVEESFRIGQEIVSAVTAMNPNPVTLKMEKVYHPCFLLTKKRYVGYSYENPNQDKPTFDAKGIETVRRDTCEAVAKTLEQSIRLFFERQDISKVKEYLQRQWTRILCGRVSLQDFVFSKEVRLGTYRASSLPPAALVATKAMRADPRAEPRYGDRIPYVVVHGEPGARLVDMVVDPLDLLEINSPYRLNDLYYINKQIIPALQRLFGLLGADLNQWFSEMPRPVRPTLAKRHFQASNPGSAFQIDDYKHGISRRAQANRTRIDYYYLSKHCTLCGELVQASTYLCDKCSKNGPAVAAAVVGKTSKLERDIEDLTAICRHCGGGDWILESGVKCTSLACSVFYQRRKVQKEFQALSSVATELGFYPRCMPEWF